VLSSQPGGGTHLFEPSGMTQFTELTTVAAPSTQGWGTNGNSKITVTPRLPFMRGNSTYAKLSYIGQRCGAAPITTWMDLPPNARRLYYDFDYIYHDDYWAQQSFNKIWFVCGEGTAGGCPFIFGTARANGSDPFGAMKPQFRLEGAATFTGSGNVSPGGNRNIGSMNGGTGYGPSVQRGDVVRWIIECVLNDTGDVANGILRAYQGVNGATPTQWCLATDVAFRGTSSNANAMNPAGAIDRLKWSPTLGGTQPPPPATPGLGFTGLCYLYASYST
jgi:hypothetical protein